MLNRDIERTPALNLNLISYPPTSVAVRLFENQAYGTTYGKGLYRRAVYNGTVDVKAPKVKYLIDLFSYQEWAHQARTDHQMTVLESVEDQPHALFSWIQRYDPLTKRKTPVDGVCVFHPNDKALTLAILDAEAEVEEAWKLDVRNCRLAHSTKNSPQLLATNTDLETWA